MQHVLLKAALLLLVLQANFTQFIHARHSRLELFIMREQQMHDFRIVDGLWTDDPAFSRKETEAYVKECQLFTLDFSRLGKLMQEKHRGIVLHIPRKQGGYHELMLARYDPFAAGFEVHTITNGVDERYDYEPGIYYSGIVNGEPGSFAAFSFFNNEVYGVFATDEGNFVLVPNTLAARTDNEHYILYNDADLRIQAGPDCAADRLPDYKTFTEPGNLQKNVMNNCKDVEVFFKGDYAAYLSFNSNVTTFTNWVTGVYNVCMNLYRNEGIYTSIRHIEINTTTDAYQSLANGSSNFLKKFGELTQNNMNGADLAMLLSTRYNGNMGGVAWRDVLCDAYSFSGGNHTGPYAFANITGGTIPAFPNYNWNVNMITHELGHNIGSPHTHNCNWVGGAIDGCYTLEGSCSMPSPQYPAAGGTIMSYCHLVNGIGVKFINGFGQQPGDLIRSRVNSASCVTSYTPSRPVNAHFIAPIIANRECTDGNGVTYYWYDNNNANESDDRVILKLIKGGNNIGSLDDAAFDVRTGTIAGFGAGAAYQVVFPSGTPYITDSTFAFRQWWHIKPVAQPASEVEVIVPFSYLDTVDMSGSITEFTFPRIYFYTIRNSNNPNHASGFGSSTGSDFTVYHYGSSPSSAQWSLETGDSAYYAHYKTNELWGGSAYANARNNLSIKHHHSAAPLYIYPNPARTAWNIQIPEGTEDDPVMVLYSTDGRAVKTQLLQAGTRNEVDASSLPAGIYFFRIQNSGTVYTGSLQKQ